MNLNQPHGFPGNWIMIVKFGVAASEGTQMDL